MSTADVPNAYAGVLPWPPREAGTVIAEFGPIVVMVRVVVTVCASGVTGLVLKLQLEKAGKPAQLKLIGLV
jgi:hypothetical protein